MSAIDYDLKKIRGIAFDVDGVLSPSTIPCSPAGEPLRMVNIKDGYAIQHAVKRGYKLAIITGGTTKAMQVRYEGLGMTDIFQGAAHKLVVLERWMASRDLKPEEVAYMGDDIPDLTCLRHVGLPVCPADAVWEVKEACRYISKANGGYGCARDLIEQVMKARGDWMDADDAFGW